ncbi:hypothetical protein [Aureliella helgolandensis]|uniref:Uncharacterized protein n=1 Tax=Aureliella helgolandensis TaxID=2527968 RepID=A0A518G9R6_9BACT|nr:hypothetical protein [Aureliella helgolandensis]QDV25313.1 hypothetical protein Q31a_36370 [Aureliella helgolandensis]
MTTIPNPEIEERIIYHYCDANALLSTFEELSDTRLAADDSIFVKRVDIGGMSSGHVGPRWWRESETALLLQQFRSIQKVAV